MKKSKISILLLVMVMILAISAVSAADIDDTSDTAIQAVDEAPVDEVASEDVDAVAATDDTDVLAADGDGNFTELQSSIDSSGTVIMSRDYVRADGENTLSISKDVTILGNNHKIDGSNLGGIFNVNSGYTLTLMGVTLINGNAENGGAIYNNGGTLTIVNSNFLNNTATKSGGAIYNNGGSITVTGSTFDGNDLTDRTVNGYGGAAIYSENGDVLISTSTVSNNLKDIVHRGGTGAYTGDLSSAAVTNKNGALTVTDSTFENNSGSYGGAILSQGTTSNLLVSGSAFNNNFAFNGGAIYCPNGNYYISESNFTGNKVRGTGSSNTNYANGGAIAATESTSDCIIADCVFKDNSATMGGAISTTNTQVTGCTFINNTAKAAYSETFNGKINNRGGMGGATYSDSVMTITGCTFENNTSRSDAVYIREGTITDSSFTNTIIAPNRGPLTISNNTYDNSGDDIKGGNSPSIYFDGVGEIPKITGAKVYYDATSFSDIQAMIDSGTTATVYLTGDVTKLDSEYETFANGIHVNRSFSINADGHTITANDGKVFTVDESGSLSLSNANVVGDGTAAIINNNVVTVGLTTNFSNVGDYAIENNGRVSQSSLTTFTQLSNLIALVNGGEIYIGSSKITKADDEKATFADGIVVDKNLTIIGYANSKRVISTYLDADNSGRIFAVNDGATLTLNNIILKNGNAEKGGAVYVEAANGFIAKTVDFINNTAVYRGGAIYSEGSVNVDNSVFDSNDITFRTRNDDNGGAAIYNLNGDLTISNTNITNNLKDIVIRNGNAGDLLVGVVVTSGDTLITDSYFANNTGSWGGAISSLGYMNTEPYTLTVKNTKFEGNNATFGGAIFVESSNLVVDNSTFENNKGVGVGSSGTSNTQGGAIVVFPQGASAEITDSTFIANSANVGGAVSLAGVDGDSLIDNCTFTDNVASSEGGAVYLWTQDDANIAVENSKFEGNTAPWGNAISNDGILSLSNNTVVGNGADIANYYGKIVSNIFIEIMENGTYSYHMEDITLNATITDDNGNLIKDINFDFTIGDIDEVHASFEDGIYTAVYTPTVPGTYVVNISYPGSNLIVNTSTIIIYKTLTDLAKLIEDADEGSTIVLNGDYAYVPEFDSALVNGIVIDKNIIINGNGSAISGFNAARLFNVTAGNTLTLINMTVRDAKADKGAGVYVNNGASLVADGVNFINNTAVYRGGAIYSEGSVNVDNSVFDSNDITFRTSNDDNGGAAIYNLNGDLTISNTNITNNLKDIVIRDGNAGDLLVGVVVTSGDTLITDSYFANNTGSWGGAISSLGY
ncbi:beta strand repeat-containing protein, partial [Methanobrevibacter sp.]|uniref:beta strand repeat-containing protein n=1 Tax=Methanobrevibacter sp. TaxID=66852 RepID=UPI003743CC1E|nr:hypothetical protein [Methanobrevibacter sp.]